MTARRLTARDIGCWVIKTSRPPAELIPGWSPGTWHRLTRCLRPSYRLDLMSPGQPCLLWLSGRVAPGVHAVGVVSGRVRSPGDRPEVPVRLALLAEPVLRADLLAHAELRDAEVLRMPAGSNPSWLSPARYGALRALGAWEPCAHTDTAGEPSPGC